MRRLSNKTDPSIAEKFPNEATVTSGEKQEVHENNHFKNHELADVRKKYVRFSVLMEYLNDILEVDSKTVNVETFAHRIRDLVYAQQREE